MLVGAEQQQPAVVVGLGSSSCLSTSRAEPGVGARRPRARWYSTTRVVAVAVGVVDVEAARSSRSRARRPSTAAPARRPPSPARGCRGRASRAGARRPSRARGRPARRRTAAGGRRAATVTNTGESKRPMRLSLTPRLSVADGAEAAVSAGVAVVVAAGEAALPLSPDPQAATSAAVTRTMTPARLTGVRMADGLCEDSRVSPITRGFRRREQSGDDSRLPPGQYLERGFPVLSRRPDAATRRSTSGRSRSPAPSTRSAAGPGRSSRRCPPRRRPSTSTASRRGRSSTPTWEGVSVDTLLEGVEPLGGYVTAFCDGGYTTNLPIEDITGGKAWVVYGFDGDAARARARRPRAPARPAPLLLEEREVGARAVLHGGGRARASGRALGYHDRGDPWLEQRYQGD